MKRKASILISALGLFIVAVGCSAKQNPAMIGIWKISNMASQGTLALRPDGSFTLISKTDHIDGTWKSSGKELTLYRDIRNGDPSSFGDGWNDSYHFFLKKGASELVAGHNGKNFPKVNFHRVKG